MESYGDTTRRSRALMLVAVGASLLGIAGCGDTSSHKNKLKPPEPINVTASISNTKVSVSPNAFGAGPVVLIITNQTSRQQDVTLETAALNGRPGIKQSTGPIVPEGGTAQLQVDVTQGNYKLSTDDTSVAPATIAVGSSRPSSQNELLQP
jgi:hypothetical protein